MTKKRFMYVAGDSFSFGQELGPPDEDFYKMTPYMKDNSYTGIISNNWGIEEYVNVSQPGGSNDRVLRMITTDLPRYLTKYKPEEIYVFITLTHPSRREFYYNSHNHFAPFMCNLEPPKSNIGDHEFWKYYVLLHNHINEQVSRYVSQILCLQAFLSRHYMDYLITRSMGPETGVKNFYEKYYNTYPDSLAMIDKKYFPDIPPFNEYVGAKKLPFGPMHHPLEEGHVAWAKYLSEYLIQNNMGQI